VRGALGNLALTLAEEGRLEEARELQERVVAMTDRDDEAFPDAQSNLAVTLSQLGQVDAALELQRAAADEHAKRDGPDAVATLDALSNVAALLDAVDRGDEADALRDRIRTLASSRYGADDPIVHRYDRVEAADAGPDGAPRSTGSGRPSAAIARDFWTVEDRLGYDFYADAIAEFIRHRDTRPPLTIGIKAPWGAGKTSLMRMVRALLDPGADHADDRIPAGQVEVSNAEVLASTRQPPQQRDLAPGAAKPEPDAGTRTTVWFNAWKYQSGEQVWSGLAHAIISQLTARMGRVERERFWATLNLRRVDGEAVRRRIYTVLVERLLPLLAAAVLTWALAIAAFLLAPVLPHGDAIRGVAGGTLLAVTLSTGVAALGQRRRFLKESVKGSFGELVRVPDYAGGAGYMDAVHEDMRRVLALVASETRPVVVFVDDLDRCSYESVAKVIEAINLFLTGEFPNCIFVLAMEPDLVAAQIAVAYKDLFEAVALDAPARERGSLGWRFLEKMVQLPLSLPPPEPTQVNELVDSILQRASPRVVPTATAIDADRQRLSQASGGGLDEVVAATKRLLREADAPESQASLVRAAELEFADQFSDQNPDVQALILEHAAALTRNPREIKRFINVFRFYAFIQVRREVRGLPAPDYRQVAKIAVLAVRWPHLLGYLGQDVDGRENVLTALERLARQGDSGPWIAESLDALHITKQRSAELASDDDLLELLRAEPAIGPSAAGFL
jgi:hypothetical protein